MNGLTVKEKGATWGFSEGFYNAFRALFRPVSRLLMLLSVTPNAITIASFFFALAAGVLFAFDRLWEGLMVGYLMAFSDIVDGQLAKEYSLTSKFGGILDSTIDRYNEFFIYAGLGARYYFQNRPLWALACGLVFLGSIMISYVKARAEADGYECRVGILQRPERLTIIAIGVAFNGLLLDPAIAFLAVFSQVTVLHRIIHVYRKSIKSDGVS